MTRPGMVTVLSLVLTLVATMVFVGGLLASWVSGCCGATGSDATPAVTGCVMAGLLLLSAVLVFVGGVTRWAPLASAAAVPIGLFAAAPHSSDLAPLAPVALAGWVGLLATLATGNVRAWMDRARVSSPSPRRRGGPPRAW